MAEREERVLVTREGQLYVGALVERHCGWPGCGRVHREMLLEADGRWQCFDCSERIAWAIVPVVHDCAGDGHCCFCVTICERRLYLINPLSDQETQEQRRELLDLEKLAAQAEALKRMARARG